MRRLIICELLESILWFRNYPNLEELSFESPIS